MSKKTHKHIIVTAWIVSMIASAYWAFYFMGRIASGTMLHEHGPMMTALFILGVSTIAGVHVARWIKS